MEQERQVGQRSAVSLTPSAGDPRGPESLAWVPP